MSQTTVNQIPPVVTLNNAKYFSATKLKKYDPAFFVDTGKTIRNIINIRSIPATELLYATQSRRYGWKVSTGSKISTRAKLMLSESWVQANIIQKPAEEKYDCPMAPPILVLQGNERFQDTNDNYVDIETRGERDVNKVIFLGNDVSNAFNMPKLLDDIVKSNVYKEKEDYVFFLSQKQRLGGVGTRRRIFVTYEGMMKILYASRSAGAKAFRSWSTKMIFTAHMGSDEQKKELATNLIGQPIAIARAVLKTCPKISCVYRIALGIAKDLRKIMNLPASIPDGYIIIKYGLTNDLDRRMSEHSRTYKFTKLGLMNFAHIDTQFLAPAEADLKALFAEIEVPIKYKTHTELVAVDPKHENHIKKQYGYISTEYGGPITCMTNQINQINNKMTLQAERHVWALRDKDREIELKNGVIASKNLEIKVRDGVIASKNLEIELRDLKLQLAQR
jgi:hypothetical protein